MFSKTFLGLVEKIGPSMSFLLILLFGFYTFGATEDKQSFFRMLFLGENIDQIYPLILMLIFFSVVLFAQKNIYKKKYEELLTDVKKRSKDCLGGKLPTNKKLLERTYNIVNLAQKRKESEMMFVALLFFVICLYLLYELKKFSLDTSIKRYRYRLYALRDKLRKHVMEGQVDNENWLFDYLDNSITKSCDMLSELNFGRFIIFWAFDNRDPKFKLAIEDLYQEFKRPENILLEKIDQDYTDILVDFLQERHKVLNYIITKSLKWLFRKGAQGLTVSPETSTFTWFSPIYRTAK